MSKRITWLRRHGALAAAVLAVSAGVAQAHTGVSSVAGFTAGVAHPLGGLDHLLAMVAVGLWAAQLGGRALWAVPVSFVAMMTAGFLLGFGGIAVPAVEPAIAVSLLALGLVVATALRVPAAAGALLVGFFAIFHGHAHGSELPAAASAVAYAAGFLGATAALHGVGIAIGLALQGRLAWLERLGGVGIAAAGLVLLIG